MTRNEASLMFPHDYILIQRDSEDMSDHMCAVLYVGDDFSELFRLQVSLPSTLNIVMEGADIQRKYSLGGALSLAKSLPFSPAGFVYVDVNTKPKNSTAMKAISFKVDSGANCTTISHTELKELDYDEDWIKSGKRLEGDSRPTVASGFSLDDCYEVVLPEINIGGWVGYNWPVLTSLSVPFKFLLGTDSMQFFNWHFDYESGVCRFNLISGKRKMLFNHKEQSIHAIDETERK